MSFEIDLNDPIREHQIQIASNALKALGYPIRLKILCVLSNSTMTVTEIVNVTGQKQSNISQHLEILRNQNLIKSQREGNKIMCSIANPEIVKLLTAIHDAFCPDYNS